LASTFGPWATSPYGIAFPEKTISDSLSWILFKDNSKEIRKSSIFNISDSPAGKPQRKMATLDAIFETQLEVPPFLSQVSCSSELIFNSIILGLAFPCGKRRLNF
jgi:hypothetical protein